ncbi:MAG: hypothetical protein FWC17_01935 [Treponema sp.]|nr:hypothetical protein [Treponema sp.]
MKNKTSILFVFAMILSALLVSSCGTTTANLSLDYGHRGNTFGLQVITPAKDFNGLGLIFTEQSFELNPDEYFNGETFTYQALLKEAKELGADAIINVVIDYRQVLRSDTVDTKTTIHRNETWFGSALAIKYTTTLMDSSTTTTNQQEWIITSSTASQAPILNSGTSSNSTSSTSLSGGDSSGNFFGGLFGR